MTALRATTDLIAFNFNIETADFMSQLGTAMPHQGIRGFLHDLAAENDLMSAELLLLSGHKPDMRDDEGRQPIHEAAAAGHIEMIMLLESVGANIDATIEPCGQTPLWIAMDRGQFEAAAWLMTQKGTSLHARDGMTGRGLLHLAARRGNFELTGKLIAAGLDVFAEDKDGMTPRDHAARAGYRGLEKALLKVMNHRCVYVHGV